MLQCYLEIVTQPSYCANKLFKNINTDQTDSTNSNLNATSNLPNPRVKLHNFAKNIDEPDVKVLIEVSLLVDGLPASPRFKLESTSQAQSKSTDQIELNDSCCYYTLGNFDSMCVDLDNLYISECVASDPDEIQTKHFQFKFNAILIQQARISYLCEPVVSDTIQIKSVSLQILRVSKVIGNTNGNEEIFLFTSTVDPYDLKIQFYQVDEIYSNVIWSSLASFDPINDVHSKCAIVIRTPRYQLFGHMRRLNAPVKVFFKLYQPSTNVSSDPCAFYYVNDDLNTYKHNACFLEHLNVVVQTSDHGNEIVDIVENNGIDANNDYDDYNQNDDDDDEVPSGFDEVDIRYKRSKISID